VLAAGLVGLGAAGCSPAASSTTQQGTEPAASTLAMHAHGGGETQAPGLAETIASTVITVYKSPTCGCCSKWVDHVRDFGFQVEVHDVQNVDPYKTRHGLPPHLASCHTAVVDGYVVEGHVPADLIAKMLQERPEITGIAVPGMPMGSPGMEGPYKQAYDVIAFDGEGRTRVFARR